MLDDRKLQLLLKEVNQAAGAYTTSSQNGHASLSTNNPRHKLLAVAKKLVTALEDPDEEMFRFALQPCAHSCALAAWECGILNTWPKERMASRELAGYVKADYILIGESCFPLPSPLLWHATSPYIYPISKLCYEK